MRFKYTAAIICAVSTAACSDSSSEPVPVPENDNRPGIVQAEVIDFNPAPGQFVNESPSAENGITKSAILKTATDDINKGYLISLGAWGGNITLRLNSPIINTPAKNDLRVLGNAFYSGTGTGGRRFGSAEPGIVYVMTDTDGNGIPDDGPWLELRAPESDGCPIVSVTYYRPENNATAEKYIRWTCSDGSEGWLNKAGIHNHDYFPLWEADKETLTFTGRRLRDNGVYNTQADRFDLYCYSGYADSHPDSEAASELDLDNAIDPDGNPVHVQKIHFVKIVTGVLQCNGILGECSTEVAGIERL